MRLTYRFNHGVTAALTAVCTAVLLAACAQTPADRNADATGAATKSGASRAANAQGAQRPAPRVRPVAAPDPEPELPVLELTDAILYEYLLAEIAGQRGNIGLSAQAYADLAKRTRDPRVARRAAEIALFARMNRAALDSARIWQETDPKSGRARQALVGLLIANNQFDEALPHIRNMLSAPGADIEAIFAQLGRTLSGSPDKAGALRLVRSLAEAYPTLPQAHVAVAQAALAASDEALALAEVRRARELRSDWDVAALMEAQIVQPRSNGLALEVLKRFLDQYPGSREVRLNFARTLVAEKRYDESRAQFQELMKAFPDDAEVVYAVGLLSMQLRDLTQAEANFRRLLELDFHDKDQVRMYLGQIAEEQKRLDDALQWYDQITEGDQYLMARIRHAQIVARQGKLADARAWLQASDVRNPQQRIQLILSEAQLMRDANDPKGAFDLVNGMLDRMPNDPDLLYEQSMLAERIDRLDVMESSLRKLIELRPDNAHAYNALGYSLADRSLRLPEARTLIERALQLAPNDAFIIDSMGWVLFRQGQVKEAIVQLQRAFSLRPDAEIAAHLGEVLWVSGDRAAAEKILQDAAAKFPDNDVLQKTLQRLRQAR